MLVVQSSMHGNSWHYSTRENLTFHTIFNLLDINIAVSHIVPSKLHLQCHQFHSQKYIIGDQPETAMMVCRVGLNEREHDGNSCGVSTMSIVL